MNKLQFLHQCRRFLLQVVKHRQQLLEYNEGKQATESMIEVMALINYWVPKMDSFDRISKYIQRTKIQNGVYEIIPSNKPRWSEKFEMLLEEADKLQHPASQKRLTFSY